MIIHLIRFLLFVYVFSTSCSYCHSQDYAAAAKASLKAIDEVIKWREEQLANIQEYKPRYDKKGIRRGPDVKLKEFWFKDKDERKSRIESCQKAIVETKQSKFKLNQSSGFPTVGRSSEPGEFGEILPPIKCKVLDVWSNSRILIEIKWNDYTSPDLEPGIPTQVDYATAVLENAPAKLQLHRLEFEIPLVQVLGDEVYDAQDGPRRVWRLKILDGNPRESFKSALSALMLKEKQNRQWTNSEGVIIGTASLAAFDGKVVTLKSLDGSTFKHDIAKLSNDDKSFVIDALWFKSFPTSSATLK